MTFNVIANYPPEEKKFPIIRLPDGTPCIAHSAPPKSVTVYTPDGSRAPIHISADGKEVYEIHPGYFIGTCDILNGTTYLCSFMALDVSGSHVIYTKATL